MMEAAERALLATTVGTALADGLGDGDADGVLADVGWLEMLEAEPRDAVAIVFTALGSTNKPATALDDVVATALGVTPCADLAVLLPPFGAWNAPGHVDADHNADAVGLGTRRSATARELLVVCRHGTEFRAVIVPVRMAQGRAVQGIDADAGLRIVRADHVEDAGVRLDATAWESAVAAGRRAVAHQIAGASRTMLELACTHALERVQFGRPVSSFQAVRHRLAEALVAVEALEATLDAAGDEPNAVTAALAKATAGRTARTVAAHCQQVLAGIGFTTDHPFHRFLKRTMVLDGLFGSADDIVLDVGRQLLARRRVPTLVEL
jgi:hypothetical protein